jgi:3-oxoadipate enol-lactonase
MQARVNDAVIYFEIEGPENSPVVTFSHSLAATLDLWDFQAAALRESYRVLRFDIRGHGKSSIPPGPYSMEKLAADAAGLLDYLDIRRTHFVGISLGGMIGQVLALRFPLRVEKLVLCDTACRVPSEMLPVWRERIRMAETEGMSALAQETLERWLSEDFRRNRPGISERIKNMIVRTPVPGYVECSRCIGEFDISRELSKVTVPTLIMVGEMDLSTPVSAAEAIHEKIRNSELVVIPGALHLTNVETAAFFNDRLLDFLAKGT